VYGLDRAAMPKERKYRGPDECRGVDRIQNFYRATNPEGVGEEHHYSQVGCHAGDDVRIQHKVHNPAVQGIFACSDGPWVEDRLGPERTRARAYIFNTLAEAGLVPTNGTDPPVDEISPIGSFHCSVTRQLPDG